MSTRELNPIHRCPLYPVFHPWSDEIAAEDKPVYWISFIAITILSCCIIPLLFYLAYYLVQSCSQLCSRSFWIRTHQSSGDVDELESIEETFAANQPASPLYETLVKEIELTEVVDETPNNPLWLSYLSSDQPFFTNDHLRTDKSPLSIQLIGTFSAEERRAINLMIEFLTVFHHTTVELVDTVLTMEELATESRLEIEKKRGGMLNGAMQYNTDFLFPALAAVKNTYMDRSSYQMAITSDDLYATTLTGFVFGSAKYGGPCIFSKLRFGNIQNNFFGVLARLMKISANEFGNMQGISYCSKHKCNMNGYMNLQELDNRPFYYCSKDVAKICFKKEITIKAYYTRLITYLRDFKELHEVAIFDKDIANIKKKLKILNKHPELYTA